MLDSTTQEARSQDPPYRRPVPIPVGSIPPHPPFLPNDDPSLSTANRPSRSKLPQSFPETADDDDKAWDKINAQFTDATETVESEVVTESEQVKERGFRAKLGAVKNAILKLSTRIENMPRRNKALVAVGTVAVAAAGIYMYNKFGTTGGVSKSLNIYEPKGGHVPSPGKNPIDLSFLPRGTITTPDIGNPLENIDTSQFSWDVAHQVSPGNETSVMQEAIGQYNAENATNFSLVSRGGTTQIVDAVRGVVDQGTMEDINAHMVD